MTRSIEHAVNTQGKRIYGEFKPGEMVYVTISIGCLQKGDIGKVSRGKQWQALCPVDFSKNARLRKTNNSFVQDVPIGILERLN